MQIAYADRLPGLDILIFPNGCKFMLKEGRFLFDVSEELRTLVLRSPLIANNRLGRTQMAKYGKKASDKVEKAMHEKKAGTLKSGRSGKKVTSRKQAIAIGLSEAREAGGKVPKKAAPKKTAKK